MAAAKHLHEYYARRLLRNIAVYDTEEVVGMLESKLATANGMGSLGLLPVVCAVMVTDTAMVQLLLEHGADVNAPTPADPPHWIRGEGGKVSEGERALHVACRNGSLPTVRLLLQAGADARARDARGRRPLHAASAGRSDYPDIVRALLDAGADPLSMSVFRQTPLHCAAEYGHIQVVMELLRAGPQALGWTDALALTPLAIAAGNGEAQVVSHLLWSGASRRPRTITACAASGVLAERPPLDAHAAKVSSSEAHLAVLGSPIAFAAYRGEEEVLRRLLMLPSPKPSPPAVGCGKDTRSGAGIGAQGGAEGDVVEAVGGQKAITVALACALLCGHPRSLRVILQATAGAGANRTARTAGTGKAEEYKDDGASARFVFWRDERFTLLHAAAGFGDPDSARLLLIAGANETAAAEDDNGSLPADLIGTLNRADYAVPSGWSRDENLDFPPSNTGSSRLDPAKELRLRHMLVRGGAAYRAESWAWPDVNGSDGSDGGGGAVCRRGRSDRFAATALQVTAPSHATRPVDHAGEVRRTAEGRDGGKGTRRKPSTALGVRVFRRQVGRSRISRSGSGSGSGGRSNSGGFGGCCATARIGYRGFQAIGRYAGKKT